MADELFLIDGNSLAYRAFFALPESIATSTGVPTNAIFGFASMLVKILTDYGPKATVVVWDKGDTGRREVYSEYKAQRTSRPDLLKEQWPAFEPLVDAFGYRNLAVEGYEADDVIASIVERARHADPPVPVMVVTGDRDAYQLVDEGVQIMTTSRGITDTRVYDREGVVERYGIPPELVPDFIGLKGDTSDNIPGVPGIGDKTAAELLQRFGSLEEVLAHVDDISGAKRKQNLIDHADDARLSKQLATIKRDIPIELDISSFASQEPDRSRLREVFREYELREPLRRLEESLGSADAAAPAPVAERALSARVIEGTLADVSKLPETEVALAVRRPASRPRPCSPRPTLGASAFTPTARGQLVAGECARPEELVEAIGDRPAIAHDAKSLGEVPEVLAHDTEIGAYLLEPAGGHTRSGSCARSAGLPRASMTPPAPTRCSSMRWRPGSGMRSGGVASRTCCSTSSCRSCGSCVTWSWPVQARHRAVGAKSRHGSRRRPTRWSGDLRADRRGVHDRVAQAARGGAVREALPIPKAAREDRLLDRRTRASGDPPRAPGDPEDRALARADKARADVPRRAAAAAGTGRPAAHDLQPDGGHDRASFLQQPEPPEHPDPN